MSGLPRRATRSSSATSDAQVSGAPVLVDTSVAVPLVAEAHLSHDAVTEAVGDRRLGLAGHAAFETYAVLTRAPELRVRPSVVRQVLDDAFPETRFLPGDATAELFATIAELDLRGGAVFDALVAAAASSHGLTLLSRDSRAAPTYAAVGVDVEWLD